MRVLTGWVNRLVAFANLKIDRTIWKSQFYEFMRSPKFKHSWRADDLWMEDADCRDVLKIRRLQRRVQKYLELISQDKCKPKEQRRLSTFGELLEDVQSYSMENGLAHFILVIKPEDSDLYKSFYQTRVTKWGGEKIKIGKFPTYNSFEQYIYTCLAEALESGDLFNTARCARKNCGKFIFGERKSKQFCDNNCRWAYNNTREARKRMRRVNAERRRKKGLERIANFS
jgi:hypothetical protein